MCLRVGDAETDSDVIKERNLRRRHPLRGEIFPYREIQFIDPGGEVVASQQRLRCAPIRVCPHRREKLAAASILADTPQFDGYACGRAAVRGIKHVCREKTGHSCYLALDMVSFSEP